MDFQLSKLSGTVPLSKRWSTEIRLALRLSLLCALCLLTACGTMGGTVTTGSGQLASEARCAGWSAISYSAAGDTASTVRQVRVHNQVGVYKRCWGYAPKAGR